MEMRPPVGATVSRRNGPMQVAADVLPTRSYGLMAKYQVALAVAGSVVE